MSLATDPSVGFTEEEVDTAAPTRSARLKWVVVVAADIQPGRAVNAAVCVAAATSANVAGVLGPDARDVGGQVHPGLPWAGCTILTADAATLRGIRAKAAAHPGTFVADMPAAAQATRVYDEYLGALSSTAPDEIDYLAVSVVGPRNRVDKIVGRLPLMA
jgi:hypothetical protein